MTPEKFSVVVVTYQRPRELKRCLLSLSDQSLPPHEVIVVDNGADINDDASRICSENYVNIRVRYIINPMNSLPTARNLGVTNCISDFIALIDDDVRLAANYFEAVFRVFENRPEAVGVQGYIKPGYRPKWREIIQSIFGLYHLEYNRCRILPTISATYPIHMTETIPCEWISGSNQVYRREVLMKVKWDERLLKYADGEDLDHSYRVYKLYPGRLFITPDASVIHDEVITGRVVGYELIAMREVYGWYLLHKLFPRSYTALCSYIWSRLGRFLISISIFFIKQHARGKTEVWSILSAYRYVWKHSEAIKRGNFIDFNSKILFKNGIEGS